jgi:hypothetical protein
MKKIGKAEASRVLEKLESDLPKEADACSELKGKLGGLRTFRVGDYRVILAILGTLLSQHESRTGRMRTRIDPFFHTGDRCTMELGRIEVSK